MGEGQNGDRLNRQIKASEAYANLSGELREIRRDLFGDDAAHVEGVLTKILASVERLERNPMIRFGAAVRSMGAAAIAFAGFVALAAGAAAAILALAKALGIGGQ
jgi:hypothetical protein